ncbi:hypothetical protein F2P81_021650 [Scophthalmus maximus]|uniref:Uncharacterized protein n=1 Tax=Scophthalmus maximus TaxID=52904 RepID=A0A6A4RXZ5_SCOMX|nr:hypothetical protein F2P81_021650 [Scophthalmus maximus]
MFHVSDVIYFMSIIPIQTEQQQQQQQQQPEQQLVPSSALIRTGFFSTGAYDDKDARLTESDTEASSLTCSCTFL